MIFEHSIILGPNIYYCNILLDIPNIKLLKTVKGSAFKTSLVRICITKHLWGGIGVSQEWPQNVSSSQTWTYISSVVDAYLDWCGPTVCMVGLFRKISNEMCDDLLRFVTVSPLLIGLFPILGWSLGTILHLDWLTVEHESLQLECVIITSWMANKVEFNFKCALWLAYK